MPLWNPYTALYCKVIPCTALYHVATKTWICTTSLISLTERSFHYVETVSQQSHRSVFWLSEHLSQWAHIWERWFDSCSQRNWRDKGWENFFTRSAGSKYSCEFLILLCYPELKQRLSKRKAPELILPWRFWLLAPFSTCSHWWATALTLWSHLVRVD